LIEGIFDVLGYTVLLIIMLIATNLLSVNAKKTIFYENVRFAIFFNYIKNN